MAAHAMPTLALSLLLCLVASLSLTLAQTAPSLAPSPAPAPAPSYCNGVQDCGNPVSVQWYQAHGWLMWLGFGLFMPIGIITSRHLQTVTKTWFYIHIGLMTLGTSMVIVGGSIAFAKFGAIPGTPADDPAALHIRLGTAVFVMACFNFLLGLIRPHKGNNFRVLWYAFHMTFGTAAVVFGWYTIYSGMTIYEVNWVIGTNSGLPDLKALRDWFTASICVLAFLYILLGRWDHMIGQADAESKVDGITRYPSLAHVSSLIGIKGAQASEERMAVEKKLQEERAAAMA